MSSVQAVAKGFAACALVSTATLAQTKPVMPAGTPAAHPAVSAREAYLPHRVYDARKNKWIDFETLVVRANAADVVFMGEQHDNGPGHAIELAMLSGVARRRVSAGGPVVLSLEMFERDVQSGLDAYLAGTRAEPEFLEQSRPWPNYAPDYRPLVELAKHASWPVVAANVPRRIASMVARGSLKAIDTLDASSRPFAARAFDCPRDAYFDRFAEQMGGHAAATGTGAADTAAAAMTQRYYESQCVKDETMAESIVDALNRARQRGPGALVVHMNGSFHSDFGLGTAMRVKRADKDAKILNVTVVPVPDLDTVNAKSMRKRADVIVFTLAPPAAAAAK